MDFLSDDDAIIRRMLSLVGASIWDWHIADDRIYHNSPWYEGLGRTPTDRPETLADFLSVVHPDDLERVRDAIDKCLSGAAPYMCEYRMVRADGETFWVRDRGEVMAHAADGSAARMAGYWRDISEQKLAYEAHEEAERRFQDMALNIPGAIFRYVRKPDGTDTIEYMSPGCEDIWEYPAELLQSDPTRLWEMIDPADLAAMQASVAASAQNLTPWKQTWRAHLPSGKTKWLEGRGQPKALDDGGVLWNSLVLDVTAQRENEMRLQDAFADAKAASEAKSIFLATMSHELRTPLNAIIGFAGLMESGALGPIDNEKYREYLEHISESGEVLLSMVNDLLDLSRVERQDSIEDPVVFDVAETVSAAVGRILSASERIDADTIEIDIADDAPAIVGDPRGVSQIVDNMVTNALKFAGPEPRIVVGWHGVDGGEWELSVADNGPGLDPALRDKIFEPFVQEHGGAGAGAFPVRKSSGVGLGLAIVKRVAALHDAAVAVDSEPGRGTIFAIRFPKPRLAFS